MCAAGLHALYALIAYRDSAQARELMERCIQTITSLWHPERGWDAKPFEEAGIQLIEWNYPAQSPFVTGIARRDWATRQDLSRHALSAGA